MNRSDIDEVLYESGRDLAPQTEIKLRKLLRRALPICRTCGQRQQPVDVTSRHIDFHCGIGGHAITRRTV